jgi:hypothetical protein
MKTIESFFTNLIKTFLFSLAYIVYLNKTSTVIYKTVLFVLGLNELNDLDGLKSIYNDFKYELNSNTELLSSLKEKYNLLLIKNENLINIINDKKNHSTVDVGFSWGLLLIITGAAGMALSSVFIFYPSLITSNFDNIADLITNNSIAILKNNNKNFDILDGKIIGINTCQHSILRLIRLIQASANDMEGNA